MPTDSEKRSRRESWPPTQVRLERPDSGKSQEDRPLLDDINDDPLTYFLTPTPSFEDEDDEMDCGNMCLDAGIEDPSHPREMVRSVSPSTLDGLRKPSLRRSVSPDSDLDPVSPDEDEDGDEEYVHFSLARSSPHPSLRDLFIDSLGPRRPQSPLFNRSADGYLSPASYPALQLSRGRNYARNRASNAARSVSTARSRQLTDHLWREPSPDVWSIEEETEDDLRKDHNVEGHTHDLKMKAAKPKKKVRFVLPHGE